MNFGKPSKKKHKNQKTSKRSHEKIRKDQKKDQDIIHTLMGNDVSIRKEFIISNAIDINNLDV